MSRRWFSSGFELASVLWSCCYFGAFSSTCDCIIQVLNTMFDILNTVPVQTKSISVLNYSASRKKSLHIVTDDY